MTDPIIPLKRCTKCGEEKPSTAEYFRFLKDRPYLRSCCLTCENASQRVRAAKRLAENREELNRKCREYYQRNREARIQKTKEYYEKNREVINQKDKARRIQNREQNKERRKRWEQANPDYQKEYARVYYQNPENREKRDQRVAEWKSKKRDRVNELERQYRSKPETKAKRHIYKSQRRAREKALPAILSVGQWRLALQFFNHRCCICGRPAGFWHTLAREHWIAINDKRPDNPGTVVWNIVPMCHGRGGCNNSKHDKDPVEWLIERYGKRKATTILKLINAYFELVKQQ